MDDDDVKDGPAVIDCIRRPSVGSRWVYSESKA